MPTLSPEQLRFAVRVLTTQDGFARDDLKDNLKIISNKYGEYRGGGFENAMIRAKTEWLQEFMKDPTLPRARRGTVEDFTYMLENVDTDSRIVFYQFEFNNPFTIKLPGTSETRVIDIIKNVKATEGQVIFELVPLVENEPAKNFEKVGFMKLVMLNAFPTTDYIIFQFPSGEQRFAHRVRQEGDGKLAAVDLVTFKALE